MRRFRSELEAATRLAFNTAPTTPHLSCSVAGVPIRFEATQPELLSALTAALGHHPVADAMAGHQLVRMWSAAGSVACRPVMPPELRDRIIRRAADLAPDSDFQLDFDPTGRMLTLMDPVSGAVTVCVGDTADIPQWERAAPLRAGLGWMLRRHGRHLVHAAAVQASDGGAALIVGPSGAGKSTTALLCREAGMGFLGDDICAITAGAEPKVHNVYGSAKTVWADLAAHPTLRDRLVTDPIRHPDYKAVFQLGGTPGSGIVAVAPLRTIIVVDRRLPHGDRRPVSTHEAAVMIAGTTATFLPGSGPLLLQDLGDLMRRIPVIRLGVGRDVQQVPDLIAEMITGAVRVA